MKRTCFLRGCYALKAARPAPDVGELGRVGDQTSSRAAVVEQY